METRQVGSLRPHDSNAEIYGNETLDEAFVESLRTHGVLEPLLITFDDRILSGHRRWKAAGAAGLAEVPVRVFASEDETDILVALVHANKYRVKTNEQLGREAAVLLKIEKEKAKQRQEATQLDGRDKDGNFKKRSDSPVPEHVPEPEIGEARDKVGETLSVSGKHAEKAAAVVQKIDELKAEGKDEEAELLRETLNRKSVSAAYRAATNGTHPALCSKCQRVGPVRGCPHCKTLRDESPDPEPAKPKPPPKAKAAPAEVPTDGDGTAIPLRCRDAWCDPWIGETLALLEDVSERVRMAFIPKGMKSRASHYPFINAKDVIDGTGFVIQYLDDVISHLQSKRPGGVCTDCTGSGCARCKLSGLLPVEMVRGGVE